MNTIRHDIAAAERGEFVNADPDDFLVLRADCRAKGWPADHPYWDAGNAGEKAPVALVAGITDEMLAFVRTPEYRAHADEANRRGIAQMIAVAEAVAEARAELAEVK